MLRKLFQGSLKTAGQRLLETPEKGKAGYNRVSTGCESPPAANAVVTHREECWPIAGRITHQELAKLLGVTLDVTTSEDGSCCPTQPVANSGQQDNIAVSLVQRSVNQHFPEAPADLEQNLKQHVLNIQETVIKELLRLAPLLNHVGLLECLIGCYHRETFAHLDALLERNCSSQGSFVLMKWVLHTYFSQELLGHPELQEIDSITKMDMMVFTEWVSKAKVKLLQQVQTEVRTCLDKILLQEKTKKNDQSEEACVALYVDTIQCADAMTRRAQMISLKLSADVEEICFQEILTFLARYTTEKMHFLKKSAKMDEPGVLYILKTLTTCKEMKQYISPKFNSTQTSLLQRILATLESLEAFTLKHLRKCVAKLSKSHFKTYFNGDSKQICSLADRIKTIFPKTWLCDETHMRVMNEVYKLLVHGYLKHLTQISQKKLTKCWRADVGQAVNKDGELLHWSISELAPRVQKWNFSLLNITELLECKDTDAVTLTVTLMHKKCPILRDDLDLLGALLRWRGLSSWQAEMVLNAFPEQRPRSGCVPCLSSLSFFANCNRKSQQF